MMKPASPGSTTATITFTVELPESGFVFHAPLPEMISQFTSESITGIPAARYLATLPLCGLPVSKVGKLRLVDRAGYVAWVRTLTSKPSSDVATEEEEEDEAAVEALLQSVGRKMKPQPAAERKRRGEKGPA